MNAAITLLLLAQSLLTAVISTKDVPPALRDTAVSIAQQAITVATEELSKPIAAQQKTEPLTQETPQEIVRSALEVNRTSDKWRMNVGECFAINSQVKDTTARRSMCEDWADDNPGLRYHPWYLEQSTNQ